MHVVLLVLRQCLQDQTRHKPDSEGAEQRRKGEVESETDQEKHKVGSPEVGQGRWDVGDLGVLKGVCLEVGTFPQPESEEETLGKQNRV